MTVGKVTRPRFALPMMQHNVHWMTNLQRIYDTSGNHAQFLGLNCVCLLADSTDAITLQIVQVQLSIWRAIETVPRSMRSRAQFLNRQKLTLLAQFRY